MSRTPAEIKRAAPGIGEHTHELLTELGYSAEDVDRLAREGAIRLAAVKQTT